MTSGQPSTGVADEDDEVVRICYRCRRRFYGIAEFEQHTGRAVIRVPLPPDARSA